MDSKLVIEQMSGRWQIKNPGLRPLAAEAAALVRPVRRGHLRLDPAGAQHGRRRAGQPRHGRGRRQAGRRPDRAGAAAGTPAGAAGRRDPGRRRPLDDATRLILVRHGETALTAQGRYSGRGDVPLSDQGEAQAMAAAGRVAGIARDVAAVVSSPLSRCTPHRRAASRPSWAASPVTVDARPDRVRLRRVGGPDLRRGRRNAGRTRWTRGWTRPASRRRAASRSRRSPPGYGGRSATAAPGVPGRCGRAWSRTSRRSS